MRPGWKYAAAASVLVLGIVVSVSGAATSGSKRDSGGGERGPGDKVVRAEVGPPGEHLSTFADELGVSDARLKEALAAVRDDLEPPKPPRLDRPPSRADMEKRCTAFTDALAKELDKTGDEVRAAIKAATKKGVEDAVQDKRISQSQADRIISRLDEATCLPVFGFHAHRGPGCGGPGKRFERHVVPAPRGSSRDSEMFAPAPIGAGA